MDGQASWIDILKTEFKLRVDQESKSKIVHCLDILSEDQYAFRFNEKCNSIGNLILHVCGNTRQYIMSTLNGEADVRQRSLEFSNPGPFQKQSLLELLENTLNEAIIVVDSLDENKLLGSYSVQVFKMTGIEILIHVIEHVSYHTGQIALICKILSSQDLGFYNDRELDKGQ
ncbi:MAG: DUF1572 domain-containing protein [Bacteroidota bacterium]|nr:DUF1572 domain-containing protein [Bacteroidota bacterium]